jgi:hypothetical protein
MGRRSSAASFVPPAAAGELTRRGLVAALATLAASAVAVAVAGPDPSNPPKKGARGSKTAKGYQLCLSQCLYDCTTPKAGAAKTRADCRVECKDECAVSREQL